MPDTYSRLASLIDGRGAGHARAALSGIPPELGTITVSGLKLDRFKHELPDYLVVEWLAKVSFPAYSVSGSGTAEGTGTQTGLKDSVGGSVTPDASFSFSFSGLSLNLNPVTVDQVDVAIKPDLKPGDRVLAILVNGGRDAVVVGKVVPNA